MLKVVYVASLVSRHKDIHRIRLLARVVGACSKPLGLSGERILRAVVASQ